MHNGTLDTLTWSQMCLFSSFFLLSTNCSSQFCRDVLEEKNSIKQNHEAGISNSCLSRQSFQGRYHCKSGIEVTLTVPLN